MRHARGMSTGLTRGRSLLAGAAALALAATAVTFMTLQSADAATLGSGSYATTRPAGQAPPAGCGSIGTNPRQWVTGNAPAGAVPTNDWWSSLLFKKFNCSYSEPLVAHPMAFKPANNGLGVSYTTEAAISGTANGVGEYHFPYTTEFTLGVAGLNSPDTKVDGWTDWTVTPYW